jgi:hypothetical protein
MEFKFSKPKSHRRLHKVIPGERSSLSLSNKDMFFFKDFPNSRHPRLGTKFPYNMCSCGLCFDPIDCTEVGWMKTHDKLNEEEV